MDGWNIMTKSWLNYWGLNQIIEKMNCCDSCKYWYLLKTLKIFVNFFCNFPGNINQFSMFYWFYKYIFFDFIFMFRNQMKLFMHPLYCSTNHPPTSLLIRHKEHYKMASAHLNNKALFLHRAGYQRGQGQARLHAAFRRLRAWLLIGLIALSS